jgi:hypothetical protein
MAQNEAVQLPLFPNQEGSGKKGVEAEIAAVRESLEVTQSMLKTAEVDPAVFARLCLVYYKGMNTLAQLVRTQRLVSGESADSMMDSVARIILELKEERGWVI